jgi:gliding motility-associated-like protein
MKFKNLLIYTILLLFSLSAKSQQNYIKQDFARAVSKNCNLIPVCIDSFSYDTIDNYSFWLNNKPIDSLISECRIDSLFAYANYFSLVQDNGTDNGPYRLDTFFVDGIPHHGLFYNIRQIADSLKVWDKDAKWTYLPIAEVIYSYNLKKSYTTQVFTSLSTGRVTFINIRSRLLYYGVRFNVKQKGIYSFTTRNNITNLYDTVSVYATCIKNDTIRKDIKIGEQGDICLKSDSLLSFTKTYTKFCDSKNGNATYFLDNICVKYTGVNAGKDTICYTICDTLGLCDTTTIIFDVIPDTARHIGSTTIITKDVYINDSLLICGLKKPINANKIYNDCNKINPVAAIFIIDSVNYCIKVKPTKVGKDEACIIICDDNKICDTTLIYINVLPLPVPRSDTQNIQVFINTNNTVCLDKSQLIKPIKYATNICPNQLLAGSSFTLDANFCIKYSSTKVGKSCVCYVYGDSVLQDTFVLCVTYVKKTGLKKIENIKINIGDSLRYCNLLKTSITTPIKSITNYCNKPVHASLKIDSCLTIAGITKGADTICIVVCDSLLCDTTILYVLVDSISRVPRSKIVNLEVAIGDSLTYCDLLKPINFDTIFNFCPNLSGVKSQVIIENNCIKIKGKILGNETICMVVCNKQTNLCDTTTILVKVIPNIITPRSKTDTLNLYTNDTLKYCNFNINGLVGPLTINQFCFNLNQNINFSIDTANRCVKITSFSVIGVDTLCFLVCDSLKFCDTTRLIINVLKRPTPTYKADTVYVETGRKISYCKLLTAGISTVDTIYNYCPNSSGTNATYTLNRLTKCIEITGVLKGVDSLCMVVCGDSICDTTFIYIIVTDTLVIGNRGKRFVDTINIPKGTKNYSYCKLNNGNLTQIDTIFNICPTSPNSPISYAIDTVKKCLKINGLDVGTDSICIVVCNKLKVCDTTIIYVNVLDSNVIRIKYDSVRVVVNDTIIYCDLLKTNFQGRIDTIKNICPNPNSTVSSYILDDSLYCVKIIGLAPGMDSVCIVICDVEGFCDTTIIYINVIDTFKILGPTAIDDKDSTQADVNKVIDVFKNDTLRSGVISFGLIPGPNNGKPARYGSVIVQNDGIVQYVPRQAFCGKWDTFSYYVCTFNNLCDTAVVCIYISCSDDFKIYTGFSPNNDGVNEIFRIDGLNKKFPNNNLKIYNRWGLLVLDNNDYQNDWNGKWNGKDLPDGTYFYFLTNRDNPKECLNGYLEIFR